MNNNNNKTHKYGDRGAKRLACWLASNLQERARRERGKRVAKSNDVKGTEKYRYNKKNKNGRGWEKTEGMQL